MAEYREFHCPYGDDFEGGDECDRCEQYELCMETPTTDVVELKPILEEYENLVQTNPTSKNVDEWCIRTMRKILADYYAEKILEE